MRIRRLALGMFAAVTLTAAAAPAFAHDDWGWQGGWRERQEWRHRAWLEQQRREQAWHEHEWREHEWREHHYGPYAGVPGYRYAAPPNVTYDAPAYYR